MNDITVRRLALVLAIQAEIEGMKAKNAYKTSYGLLADYTESHFREKAKELRSLVKNFKKELV